MNFKTCFARSLYAFMTVFACLSDVVPLPDGFLPFTVPRMNNQGVYDTVPFTLKADELLLQGN